MNLAQAKNKILLNEIENENLMLFIKEVELYNPSTIDEKVIYEYAMTGSLLKVTKKINEQELRLSNGKTFTQVDVSKTIKSKPKDELHKIVRSYLLKKSLKKR